MDDLSWTTCHGRPVMDDSLSWWLPIMTDIPLRQRTGVVDASCADPMLRWMMLLPGFYDIA
ncbi:hypothetical protein GJ744_007860 [Endocarpon pusillum]|uniref:Uncharacterized protein n=1 Tax=Endocarpon pusillum TaxID=364733 RepID=A0A8H7ASZ2_9EURO|nr:hypothetical protein GJ744_007860 [Endocarpon pusillum]